ncbi:MAG: type II toxin-antitoxin system VapC family toxin [Desulfobacterota bacterium]|jgi:predicted nucleic acid-binding protein|nr:type II toxin-antitoxin system VapC family toxin [Thermodesulfobacteriota bacterium]
MTGLDTGFFVKLLQGDSRTVTLFAQMEPDADLCLSSLTIFELKRLGLKGALDLEALTKLIETIMDLCHISWLDSVEIHTAAAGLSHGLGLPALDALILAGLLKNGSELIYTTDAHFEKYHKKGVRIVKL